MRTSVTTCVPSVVFSSDDLDGEATPGLGTAKSPSFAPLSPPPVDDEVIELENKVSEASERVAQLRSSMSNKISELLVARLEECRPTVGVPDEADYAEKENESVGNVQICEEKKAIIASLEPRLRQQLARLPQIRAQLEQAELESQKILEAVKEEESRPAPNTVERALYNLDEDPEPSEAATAAVKTGVVSTRRGRSDARPEPVKLDALYDEEGHA